MPAVPSRPITLALTAAILGGVALAPPARGDLKLCNTTSSRIGVAIGYQDPSGWTTEGWWNISAQTCETLYKGTLSSRFYYIHAVDVIKPAGKRSLVERLASLGGDVPPAFGGPAAGILITDGHADAARRGIAQLEVAARRRRQRHAAEDRGGQSERDRSGRNGRHARALGQASTRMTRKSLTFVCVGPRTMSPPATSK